MKEPGDIDTFTLSEAASLLGVKADDIRLWIAEGCPCQKSGKSPQVRIRDVFEWRIAYEREQASASGGGTGYLTLTDAAAVLGKKVDTLKKWFTNGCPVRKDGRNYEVKVAAVFEWRLQYEREVLSGGEEIVGAKLNLEQERAKLAREQTIGQQMANAVKRGELVYATEVDHAWANLIAACTVKLRSLGNKIAARLPVPNKRVVAADINKEIDRALRELSANGDSNPDSQSLEAV